jgi:hypothetical protein
MKQQTVVEMLKELNAQKMKVPILERTFKLNNGFIVEFQPNKDFVIDSFCLMGHINNSEEMRKDALDKITRLIEVVKKFNNNEISIEDYNTMVKGIINGQQN